MKRTFFFTGRMLNETEYESKRPVGMSPERHIAPGRTKRIVVPLPSSLGLDIPAVQLRDVFHNGQAEGSSSNILGGAGFIGPIEALENSRQVFFVDADAAIIYAQDDLFVAPPTDLARSRRARANITALSSKL